MTRSEYYDAVKKKYNISEDKKNIILIGTPDHGNLGDHAIAYATLKLLAEIFPDDQIYEVNMHDFPFDIDAVYHATRPEDIIILQGGGNLGNIYMDDEMIRRYVVMRFTENKIIMFPQSVYFSNDAEGAEELAISRRIYGDNKNLYLIARDERSEKFLKENFKNQVYRLPDVVLTLPPYHTSGSRNGVLLCLRNDREKVLPNNMQEDIMTALKENFDRIEQVDTVIEYDPEKFNRIDELNKKWDELSSAELIITDRLHGVIFSVLTGTPCIALPDFNRKTQGIVDDLKDIQNIILIDTIEQFDSVLKREKQDFAIFESKKIRQKYITILESILFMNINSFDPVVNYSISEIFQLAGYWNKEYYTAEYWKNQATTDYRKLENNNFEKEKEVSTYKEWVINLKKQLKHQQVDYQYITKNIEEKNKELEIYKVWVENLEKQLTESRINYENTNEELKKMENELNKCTKLISNLNKDIEEKRAELIVYKEKNNIIEEELKEQKRQWNIRQRELYILAKTKMN